MIFQHTVPRQKSSLGRVIRVQLIKPLCFYDFELVMFRQLLSEFFNGSNHKGSVEDRFELMPNWCSGSVGRADCGQCSKAIAGELRISSIIHGRSWCINEFE